MPRGIPTKAAPCRMTIAQLEEANILNQRLKMVASDIGFIEDATDKMEISISIVTPEKSGTSSYVYLRSDFTFSDMADLLRMMQTRMQDRLRHEFGVSAE